MVGGHVHLYNSGVFMCKSDGGMLFLFLFYVLCLIGYTKYEYFSTFRSTLTHL